MNILIRECTMEDLPVLRGFAQNAFNTAFRHMNTPDTMEAYLEKAFDADKLRGELKNPFSRFYFLYMDEKLAGYLKLNVGEAQTEFQDPLSLEIERIYVGQDFQGRGLGSVLMDKAQTEAKNQGKAWVWLGVWEKNEGAVRFYRRNGFENIGKHSFFMGEEEQTDYIMRKDLL